MPGDEKLSELDLVPDQDINEELLFYVAVPNPDRMNPDFSGNPYVSHKMTLRQLKTWLDSQPP